MAVPLQVNQPYTPGFSAGDLPEMQKVAQAFMSEMVPEPGVSPWPAPPTSGYAYIPGTPILIQWGVLPASSSGAATATFPVPFQQAIFNIQVTPWAAAGGDYTAVVAQTNPPSLSSFLFEGRLGGALVNVWVLWLAIGI